jgi:hypothetical protein
MNTGAHYQNTSDLIFGINSTLNLIYKFKPEISIIYRSTSTGHAFPLEKFQHDPTGQLEKNATDYTAWKYYKDSNYWNKFKEQNDKVQNFIYKNYPQVLYLDVYNSTLLRSDSHLSEHDGLHYCLLGNISIFLSYFSIYLTI